MEVLYSMENFNIKTNRAFTKVRRYAWIFTVAVAIGGLWYPKLGLLVLPIILSLTVMSFFKGRYWCGNFCPHGSLYDHVMMPLSRNKMIFPFLKSKITVSLFFLWFLFNLSRKFIRVSAFFGTMAFWDKVGFIFVTTYLMVLVVGGTLSFFNAPRSWCQICPMGVLQRTSYRLGKFLGIAKKTDVKITIASKDMCHTCGKCARVCPMQLTPYLEFNDNNQLDSPLCIRCSTCVENCPANILSLNKEAEAIKIKEKIDLEGYESRQKIQSQIVEINELASDLREFKFEFIKPSKVEYKPGQFILVKIQENPIMYRAYSISSYNEDGTSVSVIIKKAPNGYGTGIIFDSFKVGDMIELDGPLGNELIVDKSAEKVLFVANGIGITPFIPMIRDMIENPNNTKDIKLVYGVRSETEFIYDEYFNKYSKDNDKFEYIKIASRPKKDDIRKGYVTDIIKELEPKGYKVYICGSKPMIKDTLKTLDVLDVKKEDVFYESA
jgi:NAD(P)H-flavin reductase/polyferredoxin